ncbi:MAG: hypothetical protein ACUZ8I_10850 [Candidatus Scalindua sp.]
MVSGLIRHVKVIEDDGNIVGVKMWQVTPRVEYDTIELSITI